MFVALKVKVPVLVGPLSAIQPLSHSLTLTFPGHLGYIRKLVFRYPRKTISLLVWCAVYIRCPGISNLDRHRPLKKGN